MPLLLGCCQPRWHCLGFPRVEHNSPAIAQALDKLEAIYGYRLFHMHHARGAELTTEGRSFFEEASALLQYTAAVGGRANSIADHLAGYVRFGCFHTVSPFYLSQIITSFKTEAPNIEIRLGELTQDQIVVDLKMGNIDLALTYNMGLQEEELDWLVAKQLRPFVLLHTEHRLAGKEEVSLTDHSKEPFVLFDGPFSGDYFTSVLAEGAYDLRSHTGLVLWNLLVVPLGMVWDFL